MTPRAAADAAVARGITWLEGHVRGWRKKIDIPSLDLERPCRCVLGQLDGDFYEAVWRRQLTRAEVHSFGFTRSGRITFRSLTAAWRRALKAETA